MLGQSIAGAQADPAVQSVMQLLALLADPERANAKLQEIALASQKAAEDVAAAKVAVAEANALTAEAKKRSDESKAEEARVKEARKALGEVQERFNDEKKRFAASAADLNAKIAAEQSRLDGVAQALQRRESAVTEVERIVADSIAEKKKYEQKLSALDSVLKGG